MPLLLTALSSVFMSISLTSALYSTPTFLGLLCCFSHFLTPNQSLPSFVVSTPLTQLSTRPGSFDGLCFHYHSGENIL